MGDEASVVQSGVAKLEAEYEEVGDKVRHVVGCAVDVEDSQDVGVVSGREDRTVDGDNS